MKKVLAAALLATLTLPLLSFTAAAAPGTAAADNTRISLISRISLIFVAACLLGGACGRTADTLAVPAVPSAVASVTTTEAPSLTVPPNTTATSLTPPAATSSTTTTAPAPTTTATAPPTTAVAPSTTTVAPPTTTIAPPTTTVAPPTTTIAPPTTTVAPPTTTIAPPTTTVAPPTTTIAPPTTTLAPTTALPTAIAVPPSTEARVTNEPFFDLVRATETWDLGYTGAGSVVAVIDTGFDASHSDFTGRVLLEVCASAVVEKCPNGEDVAEGPGMAAYLPGGNHGTGVAGVVHQLAPDAEFIFITPMGSTVTSVGSTDAAYQWVIDNAEEYGIDALVMSYGATTSERKARNRGLEGQACFDAQADDADFATMQALGVVPVVASGNDGRLGWINAPSCLDHTVSVGWVNEYGTIHELSNVADGLTLLAPSELTAATIPENGLYETFGGTSGAAPVVGALIAIGRQINPGATVDELIATARDTGRSVDDYEAKDLRLVDLLAFSQTLAGLPVTPKKEIAFEIDGTTSLKAGTSLTTTELCALGGFTLDCTSVLTTTSPGWISGSNSVCTEEGIKIVGVSPGTCIYAIKLATYDPETKEQGPWETKVIQVDIVPLTADAVTSLKAGTSLQATKLCAPGGFTLDCTSPLSSQAPDRISGSDSVCTIEEWTKIVGVSPGTCIYSIKLATYDVKTKKTGPWETKVIQFNVTN
jgi:hypothetical protein